MTFAPPDSPARSHRRGNADVVIIGAGPNGLVAACTLADAGWDVVVLEAEPDVGGAVRSHSVVPGFVHDRFSAFYPLAAASSMITALDLESHGLRWSHAPTVLAHLADPDSEQAAVLHRDPMRTAAGLEADHPGDGEAWLRLTEHWQRVREPILGALCAPAPPLRTAARLAGLLGLGGLARTARLAALPVHRLGEELFGGQHGRLLLTGNALHADVPSVAPVSAIFGWLLAMLAQDVGFPVPQGGSGRLSQALAARARSAGVQILTGERVERVVVRGGTALGVITAGGTAIRARRAVLADVPAPMLFGSLVEAEQVPAGLRRDLENFQWDLPTVKVNWALRGAVPWRAVAAADAGTVHLGTDVEGMAMWSTSLAIGRPTDQDFLLVGQMARADVSRAPAGGESLWAYSHLPRGASPADAQGLAARMDALLEAYAPGFADLVIERWVQGPAELENADLALVGGTINGGTAQLHQQLIFRPTIGLGRPETSIDRLLLAGSSAHPGGGVHGAAGYLAARAALTDARFGGATGRALTRLQRRLQRPPGPGRAL